MPSTTTLLDSRGTPLPFEDFAAELLRDYAQRGHRCALRQIRQALDRLRLAADLDSTADIDDDAIARYIAARPPGQPDTTFYAYLSTLRAAFNRAVELRLIPVAPSFPFIPQPGDRAPAVAAPRAEVLAAGDVARFLGHLERHATTWVGARLHALACTVVHSGLLRDEALHLRVVDCDTARRTIRIRRREGLGSSPLPATIRIPAPLAAVLSAWLPRARSEWAFPNAAGRDRPWTGGTAPLRALGRLKAAGAEAGVPGVTFESLRRFSLANATADVDLPAPATGTPTAAIPDPSPPDIEADRHAAAPLHGETPASRQPGPVLHLGLDDGTRFMAHLKKESADWDGHRLFALAAVALFTGFLRKDAIKLTPEDCDLRRGLIRPPGEGRRWRKMPDELAAVLRDWLPRAGPSWAFPGVQGRGPWNGGRPGEKPSDRMRAAGVAAGVGPVSFGSLRGLWTLCNRSVRLGQGYDEAAIPARPDAGPTFRRPGPRPRSGAGATAPRPRVVPRPAETPDDAPAVRLKGKDRPPTAWDVPMPILTPAQYEAVEALVKAGTRGLSLKLMKARCRHAGWRHALIGLKKADRIWDAAIIFGGPHRPYRIARMDETDGAGARVTQLYRTGAGA